MIFLQAVVIKMKVILKIADHFHTIHSYKKIRVFKRTRNKERGGKRRNGFLVSTTYYYDYYMSLVEKEGHILNDNTTFPYLSSSDRRKRQKSVLADTEILKDFISFLILMNEKLDK